MRKFEVPDNRVTLSVGDKVRVNETSIMSEGYGPGAEGEVVRLDFDSVWVRITKSANCIDDTVGNDFGYWPTSLDLIVEPARKFAVGDRVRLTVAGATYLNESFHDVNDAREGMVGMVIDTTERLDDGVYVEFPDMKRPRFGSRFSDGEGWAMIDERIELIIEAVDSTTQVHDDDDDDAVTRIIGAKTDYTRFLRTGDLVEVRVVFDEENAYSVTMTLAQFNEVHRIINEEGNA